jgi:antitoxin FitA
MHIILQANDRNGTDYMASLMIRDLPVDLHERLKERAKVNRRSLNKEALVILEEALGRSSWPTTIEEIDNLRVRGARPLTQEMLDDARESGRP